MQPIVERNPKAYRSRMGLLVDIGLGVLAGLAVIALLLWIAIADRYRVASEDVRGIEGRD